MKELSGFLALIRIRCSEIDNVVENLPVIDRLIAEWVKERTAEEVQKAFDEVGAVVGKVYNAEDIVNDPQYLAREAVYTVADNELGDIKMQGLVAKLSRTPGVILFAGQKMGESNQLVYGEMLGMSEEKISELKEKGII